MPGSRPRIRRRASLCIAPALILGARAGAAQTGTCQPSWAAFQERFVTAEGRVVDTGNGNISHSEGQGWALLMALHAGDRAGFERVLDWTRGTLQRPGDMLHAWRYKPDAPVPVNDSNNATDGDLCIAWALVSAGERWGNSTYAALGANIARDVLRLLVRRAGPFSVLLPAIHGFEQPGGTILNLSYYVFPAFKVLARAVPDPAWARLAADGLLMTRHARFGRWDLPPDWLHLDHASAKPVVAEKWPPRFSYDAVRVPLWLVWAGLHREPAVQRAHRFWNSSGMRHMPAYADLVTNVVSPYPASAGIAAVARLSGPETERSSGVCPRAAEILREDYYSAALLVLAGLADSARSPSQG